MRKKPYDLILLAVCLLLGAFWHTKLGYTLPYPCGDEVVFYYPAQALAQHGTLQTAHLHPDRAMFWMPPAYMATLAAWIKLTSTGLLQARWLSFLLAGGAFVGLWFFWKRMQLPAIGLGLLALMYLGRYWAHMGNMLRMEGLLMCLFMLLLWAVWEGKTLAALGLGLLALTVHPNAVYMLLALPALALLAPKRSFKGKTNLYVGGLGLATVGGYGGYVLAHWAAFTYDWAWQLGSRTADGWRVLIWRADQAIFLAVLALLALWVVRTKQKNYGFVLVVATTLWTLRVLGQGWAYGIFSLVGLTLVLGVGLAWAEQTLDTVWHKKSQFYKKGALAVAMLLLWAGLCAGKMYTWPLGRTADYFWMGMPMQSEAEPYLTENDVAQVRTALYKTLPPTQQKVYFVPEGEGMAVNPEDTGRILHVLPMFGKNLPSYFVVHYSKQAAFFHDAFAETMQMLPKNAPIPAPFYSRGTSERWYLLKVQNGVYPPYVLLEGDPRLPSAK